MGIYGYDLAGLSVDLFNLHEKRVLGVIGKKNVEIETLTKEMEDLQHFLSLLEKASSTFTNAAGSDHSLELSHEDIEKIQRLAANPELHHIFPPAKFSWKEGEITATVEQIKEKLQEWAKDENVKRLISQRIEGPLQRKIGRKSEDIMLEQQELTKAVELFNRGLQRMLNLCERILSNMQRVH